MPKKEEKIIEEELIPQSNSEVEEIVDLTEGLVEPKKEIIPAKSFVGGNRDRRKNERRPSRRPRELNKNLIIKLSALEE